MSVIATTGPVHIVGSGLLGASIGLALREHGVPVTLEDASPMALALAAEIGAGSPVPPVSPKLVIVATPPDVAGSLVAEQLRRFPEAIVTDVASVKEVVFKDAERAGSDLSRYVGSHPMAGRETSGPAGAIGDLFVGRPWVIAANAANSDRALLTVRNLASDLGASVVELPADEHDDAVALVSHLPQIVSSLTAARLVDASTHSLELTGQGLRDVVRIASSDPNLWAAILLGNAERIAPLLRELATDLERVIEAVEDGRQQRYGRAMKALVDLVAAGNVGASRIPGKHGGVRRRWDQATVLVPDAPGELGRLFAEAGAAGLNLEDVQMEHSAGQPVGLVTISVIAGQGQTVREELSRRGWRVLV